MDILVGVWFVLWLTLTLVFGLGLITWTYSR